MDTYWTISYFRLYKIWKVGVWKKGYVFPRNQGFLLTIRRKNYVFSCSNLKHIGKRFSRYIYIYIIIYIYIHNYTLQNPFDIHILYAQIQCFIQYFLLVDSQVVKYNDYQCGAGETPIFWRVFTSFWWGDWCPNRPFAGPPGSRRRKSTRDICQLPSSPWASQPRISQEMETKRCVDQQHTVDGCEILHQLKTVLYPMIYRVSTVLLVVQDFFHPPYVKQHMTWNWHQLAINIHRHGWFKVSALWNMLATSLIWYTSLRVAEMDEHSTRMY